jgi:hypothetical protein
MPDHISTDAGSVSTPSAQAPSPFYVGQLVTWLYTPRGGYGFTTPVDATVIRVNPKSVRIQVWHKRLGLVERNVKMENLREREARP